MTTYHKYSVMLAVIINLDVTPGRKLFLPIQIRLGAPILHFYSILTFLVTLLILLITYSMSVFSARLYILQEDSGVYYCYYY